MASRVELPIATGTAEDFIPPRPTLRTLRDAARLCRGCNLWTVGTLRGWSFVICGAGPDEGRLRMLARRFGVEDRVEFRGWVPRRDLLALMQGADVMLFPSFHEEAGWAVAEAVSVGLPVVCLDRGGPVLMASEVVRSGWPGETAGKAVELSM